MKKVIFTILLAITSLYGAGSKGGFALGLNWGDFNNAVPSSLEVRYNAWSIDVGLGLNGANIDYYLFEPSLASFVKIYAGLGAGISIGSDIGANVRVPVGLGLYPFKQFEIYVEGAPTYTLLPSLGNSVGVNTLAGFRYYF